MENDDIEKVNGQITSKQVNKLFIIVILPLLLNAYISFITYRSTSKLQYEKLPIDIAIENRKTYNSILIEKNNFLLKQQGDLYINFKYGWLELYEANKYKDDSKMKKILSDIESNFEKQINIYQSSKSFMSDDSINKIEKFLFYIDADTYYFNVSEMCRVLMKQDGINYFYGLDDFVRNKEYLKTHERLFEIDKRVFAAQYFPIILSEIFTDELKKISVLLQTESSNR